MTNTDPSSASPQSIVNGLVIGGGSANLTSADLVVPGVTTKNRSVIEQVISDYPIPPFSWLTQCNTNTPSFLGIQNWTVPCWFWRFLSSDGFCTRERGKLDG